MKAALGAECGTRSELKCIMDLKLILEERELEIIAAQRTITKLRMWSKLRTSAFQQKCLSASSKRRARCRSWSARSGSEPRRSSCTASEG